MSKRTLFIGDVHGCYDELIALIEKIGLTPEDDLYFVGDLINKGPKSLEVVEWVMARANTWSVIGNHEYFLLRGVTWTGNLVYKETALLLESVQKHKTWLLSLPPIIEREDFILVHGGLHPDQGKDTPVEIATMIRVVDSRPWYESYTGEKLIIYGHWAADGLRIRPSTIGLDTGCCFGGHLTAYCLETREVWQVRANAIYKEPENWREKSE